MDIIIIKSKIELIKYYLRKTAMSYWSGLGFGAETNLNAMIMLE